MDALPVGFMVFLFVMTVSALVAWTAPARPRWLGRTVSALATGINELPLVAFVLLAHSTWLAVTGNELLTSAIGWMLFAVAVGVELLFVVLLIRGLRARAAVAHALTHTFGGVQQARGTRPVWRTLLTPLPVRPWRVERIGNLSYGPGGRRNRLDVYRRRSSPAGAPVLVYLHGGGYFSGGKRREARALLYRFADQGWVCVSAAYRLRPRVQWPDHLIDAKRVLAWVREHAADFGADPSTLVMAGSSAGAHLAAVAALSPNEAAFQPGFEHADTSVAAAVCLYGYYGIYYGRDEHERPSSSPLLFDATNAPAFFIAHGDHDTYVPVYAARALAGKLRAESSSPVVYVELPGGHHGFDVFRSPRFDAVLAGIETFAARAVGSSAAAGRAAADDNPTANSTPTPSGCSVWPSARRRSVGPD